MDPLTQGLLGATVGQALYARALGRRALVFGGLVGMTPDLDTALSGSSPLAEWLWHRGPTHSLGFAFVAGPALGWLLWRWQGGRLRDWIGLSVLALFTHPLLDVFTTYGTQLLTPFSRQRFALDAVAIVDPLYSLLLAAALAVGWRRGAATVAARGIAWVALAATTAYLLAGQVVNARAEAAARTQLAAEGLRDARVAAYPTLLQLPFRRLVAHERLREGGERVRIGWWNALRPQPIVWETFVAASGPAVEAARGTHEARTFEWFAMGETAARLETTAEGSVVEIDDLRYGFPGFPRDGLWGVRVRLDASGRPLGPGRPYRRRLPVAPGRLLMDLLQATFGGGQGS